MLRVKVEGIGSPAVVLAITGCVLAAACIQRERLNADCKWTGDPSVPLDLRNRSEQRHLDQDLMHAEELAVRYGDARTAASASARAMVAC